MSKNTDAFDRICGDCAGLDMNDISTEDVIAQAKICGANEEDLQSAIYGLNEYRGNDRESICPTCGLTYPDAFADIFGEPSRCPRCEPYMPGTVDGPSEEELAAMECEQSIGRPPTTCEVCGAEIKTNAPNFYTLFGQRACCDECMSELSKKQVAETSKKLFGGGTK